LTFSTVKEKEINSTFVSAPATAAVVELPPTVATWPCAGGQAGDAAVLELPPVAAGEAAGANGSTWPLN